jgi:chromosome segregation ATPase
MSEHNDSTQALEHLKQEMAREDAELRLKEQELHRKTEDMKRKEAEFQKAKTEVDAIQKHIDELKQRRQHNQAELIKVNQELQRLMREKK